MLNNLTILHVDDDESLRWLFRTVLESLYPNSQVIEASNGREGIELAQSVNPDVIVLDFYMPVMNGYEMAVRLQESPTTRQIPLVLSSSEDRQHPMLMQLRMLCRAELPKPYSRQNISALFRLLFTEPPIED